MTTKRNTSALVEAFVEEAKVNGSVAPEIKVSLDIHGFAESPDEITSILGILPSRVWVRGESVPKTSLKRKENHWILDAAGHPANSLQRQLAELTSRLKPLATRFQALPPNSKAQFYCAVYDYDRSVVLGFDSALLSKLCSLGAELNVDYHDMSSANSTIASG